ncbi:MAG: cobyrinate a,c-diamide synthase [Gammaproteobacteria bacterium]
MISVYLTATHKSSGKTVIALGLCRALVERGIVVQPFKKGPDYIDPIWLGMASRRDCHNLDFHTMDQQEIRRTFERYSTTADVSLVEGNKGLYDGVDTLGSDSNAALAKLLVVPVVLVVDCSGMTRGIAPLLLGYQQFDAQLPFAGVILNRVAGLRHEGKLRAAIERYTDFRVLGAVARSKHLEIVERHLGLIPGNEVGSAEDLIETIASVVGQQVDLEGLGALAPRSSRRKFVAGKEASQATPRSRVRIGIARDAAFGFYYPGDLEALTAAGAELVPINTLHDSELPRLDGLFVGGGFPETQMPALEANQRLRSAIKEAVEGGLPVYAECGGLMYLSRSIRWFDRRCEMVGAIPADTEMCDHPQGRGYVRLRETGEGLWPLCTGEGALADFPAHEFHYSKLVNYEGFRYAYDVLRGHGVDGEHDGIVIGNMLASFSHLRDVAANPWAERFVGFARACRGSAQSVPSF